MPEGPTMKMGVWGKLKLAAILVPAAGVVTNPIASTDDAWVAGAMVGAGIVFLALLQLAAWFILDIITLRRGGWVLTSFDSSPLTAHRGPFLLNFFVIAL